MRRRQVLKMHKRILGSLSNFTNTTNVNLASSSEASSLSSCRWERLTYQEYSRSSKSPCADVMKLRKLTMWRPWWRAQQNCCCKTPLIRKKKKRTKLCFTHWRVDSCQFENHCASCHCKELQYWFSQLEQTLYLYLVITCILCSFSLYI